MLLSKLIYQTCDKAFSINRTFAKTMLTCHLTLQALKQRFSYSLNSRVFSSLVHSTVQIKPKTTNLFLLKRCYSVDSDYGKYSSPERIEVFYDWAVNTSFIQTVEKYLTNVHDFTGLPWWTSIILSTIVLRILVMTPLYIMQVKNNIRYYMFLPLFKEVYDKLSEEVNEAAVEKKWDQKTARQQFFSNLYRHRKNMYKKYNVPGIGKRYLLPFVQIPVWFSMSISLRHMTFSLPINLIPTPSQDAIALQFSQEGCLWFSNLCAIDSFYILPILLSIINLSIIEIYRGDAKSKLQGLQKFLVYATRGFAILLIPVAMQMPSGVVLYWLCSSMYGATQALMFRSHRIRKFFKIPISTNDSKTPYRDLLNRLLFWKV